ncbi:hypothetical protein AOQ84DRAFT_432630 [Glonium stellatum]|uniref:Uncharacterized protein n=1 Tax=Glonium stellatum TaxID=574774 RepID=A0A8E2JRF5_9PEZI|nr:hypothetical protein AOQ84DRAFT_432630 [Glonium stellatum]
MASPVLLFFGAGPNVGLSVIKKFRSEGYKIAAVARTLRDDLKTITDKAIAADLSSDPSNIARIFEEVEKELGVPTVVVYNAYSLTFAADDNDPFTVDPSSFAKDIAVNATSAYAAAAAFAKLPPSPHPKVFIHTGNMQFSLVVPQTFSLGVGKSAMAYVIETAANVYGKAGNGEKGYWYFADERTVNGDSVMSKVDGPAHAEYYWELVNTKKQGPWNATFAKGIGYKDFESHRDRRVATVGELMGNLGLMWPPA